MNARTFWISVLVLASAARGWADPPTGPELDVFQGVASIDQDYYRVRVYNDAVLNMSAFTVIHVESYNDATFNLSADGLVTDGVVVEGSSLFNMAGGSVRGVKGGGTSVVNILGGELSWVMSEGLEASTVNLRGGTIQLVEAQGGIVNVFGYAFVRTPQGHDSILTGKWQDGTPFDMRLFRDNVDGVPNPRIVLHEIPEPYSLVVLLWGGMLLKRSVRKL